MFKVAFCEPLENRRLLSTSTFTFYLSEEEPSDTDGVATASFSKNDDKATITVSGLPDHKMWKTTKIVEGEGGGEEGGEEMEGSSATNWWAGTSNSETFDVDMSYVDEGEGIEVVFRVWQPTVGIGGGGTVDEVTFDSNGDVNTPPIGFTVSRDTPYGYQGTEDGDDEIPDTSVNLSPGGTATPSTDYSPAIPSSVTLKHSEGDYKAFSTTPVLDEDWNEYSETITATITSSSEYNIGAATASATTQPANLYVSLSPTTVNIKTGGGVALTRATVTATVTVNGTKPWSGVRLEKELVTGPAGGGGPLFDLANASNGSGVLTFTVDANLGSPGTFIYKIYPVGDLLNTHFATLTVNVSQ